MSQRVTPESPDPNKRQEEGQDQAQESLHEAAESPRKDQVEELPPSPPPINVGLVKPKSTACWAHTLLVGRLLSGSGSTLSNKWANNSPIDYRYRGTCKEGTCPPCTGWDQPVPVQCAQPYYNHPFIQTMIMFVGEFLNYVFWIYQKCNKKANIKYEAEREEAKSQGHKPGGWQRHFWLFFPAFLDAIASNLSLISLTVIPGSINSMLGSLSPFFVAIYSICMLNADLYVHNYIAFLFVIVGSTLTALSGVVDFSGGTKVKPVTDALLYAGMLILLFLSLWFAALQMVVEEILYQTWYMGPAMAVGTEGAWGLIIYTIVLGITCNVPCTTSNSLCIYNPNDQKFYVENIDTYVQQLSEESVLIGALILNIFCIALYNYFGQAITKYINAITRMIVNAVKAVTTWIIGLIVTLAQPKDEIFKPWEDTDWRNILIQLTGFLFLVLALVIHRKMLKLPFKDKYLHDIVVPCECCKCNKSFRELGERQKVLQAEYKAEKRREAGLEALEEDDKGKGDTLDTIGEQHGNSPQTKKQGSEEN